MVEGKNIYNFIFRLNKLGIDLLNINYINKNAVKIEVYKKDYEKIIKNKTIYDINIISYLGLTKIKKDIVNYKYILFFITISFMTIYFLSNLIFQIDIITNDNKMKKKINDYLYQNDIRMFHFKKSYQKLKKIKEGILHKYKNEIDWIEIESVGSKYIIRFEPRLESHLKKEVKYQSIIAKKNAIIYKMNVKNGQIVKNRFDYVKKGDVIVSGYIYLNDKITNTVEAMGDIYGETWYKVKCRYPLKYKNIIKTNKSKKVFTINFLNKEIELFNFNKYKNYEKKNNTLLKNYLLPIAINYQTQHEVILDYENNSYDEALKKAIKTAFDKISKKFTKDEYIKNVKILKTSKEKNYVNLELFISTFEIISSPRKIDYYEPNNTN